ncbi:uncharacterized protein TNCT_103811 [Trichonephila clavata]|uniref:Uncharacterized protein n=1 Tax=Trichonephila clavata TaxID=2740835 RepID=A0A8X6FQB0_TRICU|nr:uncharacterized protein TNCT_103811 [Trichonephila clavata]
MNKKIDESKDQYYENKDIIDAELAEIEADLQEMEDRLEDLEVRIRNTLNSLIAKPSVSSVHSCENKISHAISKQKLEIELPTVVNCQDSYTKRDVLSIIARLFDRLGFIGPILTKAKPLLQKLWVLKLEWDEPLKNPIAKEWNDFVSTLPVIQNIHISRLVLKNGRIILHGFSDSSTAAYGAVLYVQSISEVDVSSRLLCSKSHVAPVKLITIPRLKLWACVLLAQLLEKVLHSLTLPMQQTMLWAGSNIVLAWIQRSPEQLKTFIGNRIKIIQRLTKNCQWNRVSSNDNPADLISRGLNASDISSK